MAVTKKIKRAPAKRGRPAKAKTVVRRGRPPKAAAKAKTRARAVAKPVKRLTRLQAAEIALKEALNEEQAVLKVWLKASEKTKRLQERVDAHKAREQAKKELIPVFTKADLKAVA